MLNQQPFNKDKLCGLVARVKSLSSSDKSQMYFLLNQYFSGFTYSRFEKDLAEKEWVILLVEGSTSIIKGFSTLMRMQIESEEKPVVALFSGDTIVDKSCWKEIELPRVWARHAFKLAEAELEKKVFWFLICSGYRTYRFLPIFFRRFYPNCRESVPIEVKRLMDVIAFQKFPSEYDKERGIVCFKEPCPLRPGVAEITENRLRNQHIAFFTQANPGYVEGDELVCLTEIKRANLTPAGRRMLE